MDRLVYPATRRSDVLEDHHGDAVADPYRWLEDPDDAEVRAWVAAQAALADGVLSAIPERQILRARLTELWDYPKFDVPFERGGRWIQTRNSGLQAQAVVFVADRPDGEGQVLLDPNGLSDDGTVAVTSLGVSDDGRLLAYATSKSGSDWMTWRVRDVSSGDDLADVLEWSKFSSATWRKDGSGFYYAAMEQPAPGSEFHQQNHAPHIRFHRVGTVQSEDPLVFSAPGEPEWFPSASVTDDDRYLIVTIQRGTSAECRVEVLDLDSPDDGFVTLVPDFSAKAYVVANSGSTFYLVTDRDAERGWIAAAELSSPSSPWRVVVAESSETLLDVQHCGGRLVCHYLRDAHSLLRVHSMDGSFEHDIPLPDMVSLAPSPFGHGSIEGRPDSDVLHFGVVSFTESGALWSHDLKSGTTRMLRGSASALDPQRFVTEQVFVQSADGTRVPMFLTRGAEVVPDGSTRVLMYGYGGFSIPLTPSFSPSFAGWLDRGGMLAVVGLRGGGEYGRSWHDAGRLAAKQNVFDDFSACAEWIGSSGWSSPAGVGITGASNGGLLVGACVTQRPELFGAAVASVGVFDMLRFHLFTIGWAWKDDYGNPDDATAYRWLRAYSPLHNVRPGSCYPPTLLMTGDHDDRVVPAHSYKFAAALQAAQSCANPVLLCVDIDTGHGLGKPTEKVIDEAADRLAFMWSNLR